MNFKSNSFLVAYIIAIVLKYYSTVHCSGDGEATTESEDGHTDFTVDQEQSEPTTHQAREAITGVYK